MGFVRLLVLGLALACSGFSQSAPDSTAAVFAPKLLPGEGLAVAQSDGSVQLFGEAKKEAPMGSLAKLVWLRLEGQDWTAMGVSYNCTGTQGSYKCWLPKGHGRVDLAKATRDSCNLAYLSWAKQSAERWRHSYGEGAARVRLEEVFSPFLGHRLPPGETIPEITPEWVGTGDLLRTSPEVMAQWLADPAQAELLMQCRTLLLSFFAIMTNDNQWWMKTGTACVPSDPAITSAWVAGSNGDVVAVLHLPQGRGKAEGLMRFKAIMGLPGK